MSEVLSSGGSIIALEKDKLTDLEHALGFDGPGVFRLKNVLDADFRQELLDEIDSNNVHWRDAGDTYVNNRGLEIVQNHDVFSLKAGGDYEPIWNVPKMAQLAVSTEQFVQNLGQIYPSLQNWQADEMSYHRYYDEQIGLSFHRDNMRFPGIIAVVAIDGECDFQVIARQPVKRLGELASDESQKWIWRSTYTIPTTPGDMVLTRAPGLLPDMRPDDRPEHAVVNCRKLPRISFMLRANSRPKDTGYGFDYYNWS